jgi:parallel beta-helix repeat protein
MEKKTVSAIMFTLLLTSMLALAFNIQPVKASGIIYIRADGTVDPPDAPISTVDYVTYTLTGNITSDADGIVVERSDIIIDGNGYTLQGSGTGNGFFLSRIHNVTIKNTNIKHFWVGIWLSDSSNNSIAENNITNNAFDGILLAGSSNNTIFGNNMTNNSYDGIQLESSSNYNNICENNITNNNESGISFCFWPGSQAWNNSISGNNIAHNKESGIGMYASNGSVISGNNIIKNGVGISLIYSSKNNVTENSIANNFVGIIIDTSGNMIYHNNFIDNTYQVDSYASLNIWDDGYPSGGNYWNDYSGADVKSGRNQDQPGSDGIGDIPYVINEDNRDRYPLMRARVSELVVSVMAPASMRLGSSLSLDVNVTNLGSNDQANVEFLLLINNTIVGSTTIPLLKAGSSYTLGYLWTPTVEGTYNVTAYAHPVTDEPFTENNQKTTFIAVVQVGVEAGNWIKLGYTITGAPSGTPLPQWIKIEFLSVEGTSATVRVTMHMSDGTEPSQTMSIDVVAGGGTFQGLSGFVIPANCTTGDSIYITGYGNITIAGETTRTYAGASRTVVYASFSQYGTQLTYYWDKLTGAMVEASVVSGGVTATGKATETNMWQAAPSGLPIEPIYLYILAALAIIIVVGAAAFIMRRRKRPPEKVENSQSKLRLTRAGFKRNFGHRITRV